MITYNSSCSCGVWRFGGTGQESFTLRVPRSSRLAACSPAGPGMSVRASLRRITQLRSDLVILHGSLNRHSQSVIRSWVTHHINAVVASLRNFSTQARTVVGLFAKLYGIVAEVG